MKKILFTLLLIVPLVVQGRQINPITQATLNAYDELLKNNPNDYITLYQRGAQYYKLDLYDKAITDVQQAINLTPDKDKDTKTREYGLLANILTEKKEYAIALEAVEAALALSPANYQLLYQKGNLALRLGNVPAARSAFQQMQRIKSRSQEAFIGLARCDIMENKYDDAKEKMAAAEEFDTTSATTYCRIGDLLVEMGENREAALKYITAYLFEDDKENRAVNSLLALADKDYASVTDAINYALKKSYSPLLEDFKGLISTRTGHYGDAYSTYASRLASSSNDAFTCAMMAKICFNLNKMAEAERYIDNAIKINDSPDYQLMKAKIANVLSKHEEALSAAAKALANEKTESEAALQYALAELALNQNEKALQHLNRAVLTTPEDENYPIMVRAWTYDKVLNNHAAAKADWERVASTSTDDVRQMAFKAIAQSLSGKQLDCIATLSELEKKELTAPQQFWLAMAYVQSGNKEKGKELLQRIINKGFENQYLLEVDNTANLNISPIRSK